MPETPYTETEALIHAMNDYDADSGNIDTTLGYLTENLTTGELRRLSGSAMLLSRACSEARDAIAREAANSQKGADVTPLVECVERLHDAGYVVLGPENAEETSALLGMIAFPFWTQIPALEEEAVRDRATAVLAAFPPSFGASRSQSVPRP